MSEQKQKTGLRSGEVAFMIAIALGLAIGILIKRIRIGIFLAFILCLLIVLSGWFRFTRGTKRQ
ncbi:MAG: hypothetical protein IPH18_03915 [Chitinophagaceae bacterium]|jgi:tetrahydromethanopterin S-methyltransferase subunit G|nr:hypothetical protein [Chitinophagaceae bacterium]MBK8953348.1 hypothetical protein [Chitinophagaceae bacterium]